MTAFQRTWLLLASACLAACAASGAPARSSAGQRAMVTLHDYRSGQRLELAGESHTNRVEYYSQPRANAARKILADEALAALIGELERLGFAKHRQRGPAPEVGRSEVIRWGLAVEQDGESFHWLIGPGSPAADSSAFRDCRDDFLQIYNITDSYQTVVNPGGKALFEDERSRPAERRP